MGDAGHRPGSFHRNGSRRESGTGASLDAGGTASTQLTNPFVTEAAGKVPGGRNGRSAPWGLRPVSHRRRLRRVTTGRHREDGPLIGSLDAALEHFREVDPRLHSVADEERLRSRLDLVAGFDPFTRLCRIVVSQMLSTAAVASIWAKLEAGLGSPLTPKSVASVGEEVFRGAGVFRTKSAALREIAGQVEGGTLDLNGLRDASDDEVRRALTAIRGVGPWTAEMFLIFVLGREDVFSARDVALRNAIRNLYELEERPGLAEADAISERWAPFRTYACLVLWQTFEQGKAG